MDIKKGERGTCCRNSIFVTFCVAVLGNVWMMQSSCFFNLSVFLPISYYKLWKTIKFMVFSNKSNSKQKQTQEQESHRNLSFLFPQGCLYCPFRWVFVCLKFWISFIKWCTAKKWITYCFFISRVIVVK